MSSQVLIDLIDQIDALLPEHYRMATGDLLTITVDMFGVECSAPNFRGICEQLLAGLIKERMQR